MTITDFTSFDDIRAALGVSQDEIKDATLSLDLYEFGLITELDSISLLLINDYSALKGTPAASWTPVQKRFHQSLSLFASYAVAKQATIALPLFAPKEQSDGKATLGRFAVDPYKAVIARILAQYETTKAALQAAYAATTATATSASLIRPYLAVSNPSSDPVTGT